MENVTLDPLAVADIEQLFDYIAIERQDLEGATRVVHKLWEKCARYARQPLMGDLRDDLGENIRTFSVYKFVVVYLPQADGLRVLRVFHGARDYPSIFDLPEDLDAS